MPLYGYVYQGVSKQNNGLYSAFSSAKSLSYNDLRLSYLNNTAYSRHRHEAAKVPYLYGNGTFISYEDSCFYLCQNPLWQNPWAWLAWGYGNCHRTPAAPC